MVDQEGLDERGSTRGVTSDDDGLTGARPTQRKRCSIRLAFEPQTDLVECGSLILAGDAPKDLVGGDRGERAGVAAVAEDHTEVGAGRVARHAVGGGEHGIWGDEHGAAVGEGELGREALAIAERAAEALGEGGGGEGHAVAVDAEPLGWNQGGERLSERRLGGGVERIAIVGAVEHRVRAQPLGREGAASEGESEQEPHRNVVARADDDVTDAKATTTMKTSVPGSIWSKGSAFGGLRSG